MVGYKAIEAAVVQQFIYHFSDILDNSLCKAADIDGVFQAMGDQDANYGCVLDYAPSRRTDRPPFGSDCWTWGILGFFLIRFRGNAVDADSKARDIIDKLVRVFDSDHRLGGLSPLVRIVEIGQPDPQSINEVPMYWISFRIEAIDK